MLLWSPYGALLIDSQAFLSVAVASLVSTRGGVPARLQPPQDSCQQTARDSNLCTHRQQLLLSGSECIMDSGESSAW